MDLNIIKRQQNGYLDFASNFNRCGCGSNAACKFLASYTPNTACGNHSMSWGVNEANLPGAHVPVVIWPHTQQALLQPKCGTVTDKVLYYSNLSTRNIACIPHKGRVGYASVMGNQKPGRPTMNRLVCLINQTNNWKT